MLQWCTLALVRAGESKIDFHGNVLRRSGWRPRRRRRGGFGRREKLRSLDKPDELGAVALEILALRMSRTVKNFVEGRDALELRVGEK